MVNKVDQMSTRMTFFSVMIFSLLMYNFYSTCVVSARLDEPIYKINDSLNELGKLNLKISSEWMDYLDHVLKVHKFQFKLSSNYIINNINAKKSLKIINYTETGLGRSDILYKLLAKDSRNEQNHAANYGYGIGSKRWLCLPYAPRRRLPFYRKIVR